jgi:6-pyruvoyltetrahydropterin/6-carboxytetrahydropterin synthase
VILARKFEFESSHFYNWGGKLRNLHGHNYEIWVLIEGELNPFGMIKNISEIKEKVSPILERFDHTLLNSLPEFNGKNPTVEVISWVLYGAIKGVIKELFAVRVFEDEDIFGAYDSRHFLGFGWIEGCLKREVWVRGEIDDLGRVEDIERVKVSERKIFEKFEDLRGFGRISFGGKEMEFRTYRFSSAHIMGLRELSYEENLRVFGKCARRESHGHNYKLIVFSDREETFKEAERVVGELDHRLLNEVIENPTLENIALYINNRINAEAIKIYETPRTYVLTTNLREIAVCL